MIINAFNYSYINTKIRALKGQLLKDSDYRNLLRTRGHLDLCDCMRSYVYGRYMDRHIKSYDELIDLYYRGLFDDFIKIINCLSGKKRELFYHLYHKYELENIKVILRNKRNTVPKDDPDRLLFPLNKYVTIPIKSLIKAKNIIQLIKLLKNTWYYDPLDNAFYRFEKEGDLFPLEMALDLSYFKRLWEKISLLNRRERRIAYNLYGIQMDILNIFWIMRFKQIFNFSPEEILNYTLMHGRYITHNLRKRLAYSITHEDIIGYLNKTPYGAYLKGIHNPDICYIRLQRYLLIWAKKNWCRFPFQIGIIIDYLLFKEIEVRNLVTITEMKRMGMSEEEIEGIIVPVDFS